MVCGGPWPKHSSHFERELPATRRCSPSAARLRSCRVGAPSFPGAPLTKPDLWASHPAFRDGGVGDGLRLRGASWPSEGRAGPRSPSAFTSAHPSSSVSCLGPMSQMVIGGRALLFPFGDFGLPLRFTSSGLDAVAAMASSELSAVSPKSPSCPASLLTVTAFPCRPSARTGFRRPSGTTRSSDFCRPVTASSFRPRRLPSHHGGRQISLGKKRRTSHESRRQYTRPTNGFRASPLGTGSPTVGVLYGASLSLGSVLHLRLPSDDSSRGRRCLRCWIPSV